MSQDREVSTLFGAQGARGGHTKEEVKGQVLRQKDTVGEKEFISNSFFAISIHLYKIIIL